MPSSFWLIYVTWNRWCHILLTNSFFFNFWFEKLCILHSIWSLSSLNPSPGWLHDPVETTFTANKHKHKALSSFNESACSLNAFQMLESVSFSSDSRLSHTVSRSTAAASNSWFKVTAGIIGLVFQRGLFSVLMSPDTVTAALLQLVLHLVRDL